MPKIIEALNKLTRSPKAPLNKEIKDSLKEIKKICDAKYSNQSFYGNAALNRQMLLDPQIATLLTPEVLTYIFTNTPTSETKIIRNTSPGGQINLKDAIYHGLKEGLLVIHMMPNNEPQYGLEAYEQQQKKFSENTMRIVSNISKAADVEEIDTEQQLNPRGLVNQYERIVKTINLLKEQGKSDELLKVPSYTSKSMREQVGWGFKQLCTALKVQDLEKETLDGFCEKFLQNPDVMLNGGVIHLFYDRAHIDAALEQDTVHQIGDKNCTFQDIFREMVQKVATNPDHYPACAKEQLCLRFQLVERDLLSRFKATYRHVIKETALDASEKFQIQSGIVDQILEGFENKVQSIGTHSVDAKLKAEELLKTLRHYKNNAFKEPSKETLDIFAAQAKKAISDVTPELQRDLGWGDYLTNLAKQFANAVTTAGAYVATFGSSTHHGFFVLKRSDAANEAEELERELISELV